MSKKQWGHGYYKGMNDAENNVGRTRYIVAIADDGHLQTIFRVLAKNENLFTVEDITADVMTVALFGVAFELGITGNNDPVNYENVYEIEKSENMICFSSRQACEAWIYTDSKSWLKEKNA